MLGDARFAGLSLRAAALPLVLALSLSACANLNQTPVNRPVSTAPTSTAAEAPPRKFALGLALSGGGTRAAAFSLGVLEGLRELRGADGRPVLDRLEFISSVSGGSVAAAHYGLYGEATFSTFREAFLYRDAESSLRTSVINPVNLVRALAGGVNDRDDFPRWLDDNVFHGQPLSRLLDDDGPRVFLNATDFYNRVPFMFGELSMAATCSDPSSIGIADAVAASAAVPIVFTPVVIQNYGGKCVSGALEWAEAALDRPDASPSLTSYAQALRRYATDPEMAFIKLLDGGLADNLGLSGFTIAWQAGDPVRGPLDAREAVVLEHLAVVVVNAGRGPAGNWNSRSTGPSGVELALAVTDSVIDATSRANLDLFRLTMQRWRDAVVGFRCGLDATQATALGAPAGWNCAGLRVDVVELGFSGLAQERKVQLDAIPTRFVLSREDVDLAIAAGRDLVLQNSVLFDFAWSR